MATLIKLLNRFSIKIQLTCKTCPHLTGKQLYGLRPLLSMIANNKNYYYLKSYPLSFMNLMYARCEVLCTNWMHVLASYSLIAALIALTPRESEKGTNLMHINIADFWLTQTTIKHIRNNSIWPEIVIVLDNCPTIHVVSFTPVCFFKCFSIQWSLLSFQHLLLPLSEDNVTSIIAIVWGTWSVQFRREFLGWSINIIIIVLILQPVTTCINAWNC